MAFAPWRGSCSTWTLPGRAPAFPALRRPGIDAWRGGVSGAGPGALAPCDRGCGAAAPAAPPVLGREGTRVVRSSPRPRPPVPRPGRFRRLAQPPAASAASAASRSLPPQAPLWALRSVLSVSPRSCSSDVPSGLPPPPPCKPLGLEGPTCWVRPPPPAVPPLPPILRRTALSGVFLAPCQSQHSLSVGLPLPPDWAPDKQPGAPCPLAWAG